MAEMETIRANYAALFGDVMDGLALLYEKHRPEKADSWENMALRDLRARVYVELIEFAKSREFKDEYDSLLDLINDMIMLAERFRRLGMSPTLEEENGHELRRDIDPGTGTKGT